jgi:hydroxymethylglutaryl-CoA lyase
MTLPVLPPAVDIREVGPRDGLQIERPIPTDDKLRMLEGLVAAGLRRIEATSFVSPRAVPALADAAEVAAALPQWPQVRWSALVAGRGGAERALAAGLTELEYVISAADGHSRANVGRTTDESSALVPVVSGLVRGVQGHLEVIIATAWDCPFDGPTPEQRTVDVARRAVDDGADSLSIADTIGTVTPLRLVRLLDAVRAACPGVEVGIHLHDTRGSGLANALAALQSGVTQLDASVGGLGGCPFAPGASGNIATEELVYLAEEMDVATGVDMLRVIEVARQVEQVLDKPLPSGLMRAGDRLRGPRTEPVDGARA